jgi:DNA polymerase IV
MELQRKIIHIDMDAFYASVEQRDDPALRGKAIAVGGAGGRGVVATCSYEARKYGVHSAMPSITAARLCPGLIFVRPRMDAYKLVSQQIRAIFHQYTDLVEPLSLDEAYLDVTENKPGIRSAIVIAKEIRAAILAETQLTATAGVSYNKFLAKMASGHFKPNGLNFIPPDQAQTFIDGLAIHKFYGIGAKTAEKMKALGVRNGADLRAQSASFLTRHFGKMGSYYHQIARGIDDRRVSPDRPTKSVSVEDTFAQDTGDLELLDQEIERLVPMLMRRIERYGLSGRTITLKVKYADFTQVTRSESSGYPLFAAHEIATRAQALLRKTDATERLVRLLGIGMSNFGDEPEEEDAHGQIRIDFGGKD